MKNLSNYLKYCDNSSSVFHFIAATPPVITVHPMNTSVLLYVGDENAVFSCEADGGSNIQYAWFTETIDGDGVMTEGKTSNTLILSPVTVDMNNTQYYCIASNNGGSDRSNSAHLTVNGEL